MSQAAQLFHFSERRNALAFWLGSTVVTIGVILHLPMFWMARNTGCNMSGMPMDAEMLIGMLLIVLGIVAAGYGLLPCRRHGSEAFAASAPPEDVLLTAAHWRLMGLLTVAHIIDIMKPANLGFVTPGMRSEYAVDRATVALLSLSALFGTAAALSYRARWPTCTAAAPRYCCHRLCSSAR